jgi:hypothetical protein
MMVVVDVPGFHMQYDMDSRFLFLGLGVRAEMPRFTRIASCRVKKQ